MSYNEKSRNFSRKETEVNKTDTLTNEHFLLQSDVCIYIYIYIYIYRYIYIYIYIFCCITFSFLCLIFHRLFNMRYNNHTEAYRRAYRKLL